MNEFALRQEDYETADKERSKKECIVQIVSPVNETDNYPRTQLNSTKKNFKKVSHCDEV